MKIKDYLCESVGKTAESAPNIGLSWFVSAISAVLAGVAQQILRQDFPSTKIDGEEFDGKGCDEPSVDAVIALMSGNFGVLRHTVYFMQLTNWLNWLMDEELPEEGVFDNFVWLGEKWNKYAYMRMGESDGE